ncbi:hypothetical protein AYO44_13670 [Planctomycetaceae bacterium SCGC AG-212-F19]|nr:hypothetical protein AYO44_13670 [Planctomycetaceae bacterium SCGC AG-212-F19]
MSEPYLALQVIMMPKDANPHPTVLPNFGGNALYATIFGGVILSYIDQAGAIGARHAVVEAGGPRPMLVTVAMNRVEFKYPVFVGDLVRFMTSNVRLGRTSVTVQVRVEVHRDGAPPLHVTEAEVVYVAIDSSSPERRPVPLLPQ